MTTPLFYCNDAVLTVPVLTNIELVRRMLCDTLKSPESDSLMCGKVRAQVLLSES